MYVSTEENGTYDNYNFQLSAGSDELLLHGVLCENGGCHLWMLNKYTKELSLY